MKSLTALFVFQTLFISTATAAAGGGYGGPASGGGAAGGIHGGAGAPVIENILPVETYYLGEQTCVHGIFTIRPELFDTVLSKAPEHLHCDIANAKPRKRDLSLIKYLEIRGALFHKAKDKGLATLPPLYSPKESLEKFEDDLKVYQKENLHYIDFDELSKHHEAIIDSFYTPKFMEKYGELNWSVMLNNIALGLSLVTHDDLVGGFSKDVIDFLISSGFLVLDPGVILEDDGGRYYHTNVSYSPESLMHELVDKTHDITGLVIGCGHAPKNYIYDFPATYGSLLVSEVAHHGTCPYGHEKHELTIDYNLSTRPDIFADFTVLAPHLPKNRFQTIYDETKGIFDVSIYKAISGALTGDGIYTIQAYADKVDTILGLMAANIPELVYIKTRDHPGRGCNSGVLLDFKRHR